MGEKESKGDDARRTVVEMVTRAEAIIEGIEAAEPDGRWAMTAFSRYRLCELLEIMPYVRYDVILARIRPCCLMRLRNWWIRSRSRSRT